jgi:membrane protein insertase Oxa1/YidC/SpoIIIJ
VIGDTAQLAIGPAFMSFFFGIKQMSSAYPSVSTGGMWWFRDLAAPDPYCVLPIVASFSFLGIMEFALRGRAASMQPMQYKVSLPLPDLWSRV